jgi:signal transduction histidine kinase
VNSPARRLLLRLVAIEMAAWGTTGLLVSAFAPRLLLLDSQVVAGSRSLAFTGWLASLGVVLVVTLVVMWRLRPVLGTLGLGDERVTVVDVLSLHAVPTRLVAWGLAGTVAVAATTLVPPLRPWTNDFSTQGELVLLAMTLASVAALPVYVGMRASVAKVMELVPVATSREAIELLETRRSGVAGVGHRLLAAVVAPVGFVALGASLLVQAHLRAFDGSSREDEAVALARGVFGSVEMGARGGKRALVEAAARGFDVHLQPSSASFAVTRSDESTVELVVPLGDGHAEVRFATARVRMGSGVMTGLALAAVAIAGLLGWRVGRAFSQDVTLATGELAATGVADVLKGGHIRGDARFQSVAALMQAADAIGSLFREFASAQQRAIDARAATERMRGLFLASMSHDLKAPLNAILGFATLVARGPLRDAQRESVGIIEQRGRELLYLIDTILDATRAEAGELTVSPEWTEVGELVMSAVLDARDLTVGQHVDVTGEIQPELPLILVDVSRLAQALTAIILVATRFADHGHVVVRAALPAVEERLRIDVEVTGRVIAAADRQKVFDAFTQADRARRHGSLGLGPALARAIVELHHGGIEVETTEAGGTVFHLWVPSERPSRAPPAA